MLCRSRCELFHFNGIARRAFPLRVAVRYGLLPPMEPSGLEFGLLSTATEEDFMRIKLLVAAAGLVALATPSLAAEFFIVQDSTTKRCTIVEQRPTTQTTTVVGGKTYTTRTEAEGAMKTVKVCESGGTVGGPVPPPPGVR